MQRWFALPHKLRFLIAGGFNTAAGYSLVFLGQYFLNGSLPPQVIFILAYLAASLLAFTVMKHLVFRTSGNYLREYLRYLLSSALSALVGIAVLSLLISYLGLNEYAGQFFAMSASVITSYIALQYYAFLRGKESSTTRPRLE